MSLTELPSLLRDEPGLTRALGDPSARIAVVEVARPMAIAALAAAVGTAATRRRLPDGRQRRPTVRRPHPVHARRRRRPLPGVGDAAVRARQPERRDDGAAARGAVAAAQPGAHTRPSSSRECAPCSRSWGRERRRPNRSSSGRTRSSIPTSSPRHSSSSGTGARSWSSIAASSPAGGRSSTSTRRPPTRRSASICGATRSTG